MQQTFSEKLWTKENYDYPAKGGFLPSVTGYLHPDEKKRPAIVIVPGGGYTMVAATEGEVVAEVFYEKGYQVFIVTYTTNPAYLQALHWRPLQDLSRAMVMIRSEAEEYRVIEDQIAVCGFSAGGHLVASLAVHYDQEALKETGEYAGISNQANAVILSYPVITSGEYAHRDSFKALLGEDASKEQLRQRSLETQVRKDMAPVFIWQCMDDDLVPIENSFLFVQACRKKKVPCEFHAFEKGGHGVSVVTQAWREHGWEKGRYVMEQWLNTIEYAIAHKQEDLGFGDLTGIHTLEEYFENERKKNEGIDYGEGPADYVGTWVAMADGWLRKRFHMEEKE